jgi:hypothetical protein
MEVVYEGEVMILFEPNELGIAAVSDALLQKQYMVAVTAYKRKGDVWEPLGSAEVLCESVGEVILFAEKALKETGKCLK